MRSSLWVIVALLAIHSLASFLSAQEQCGCSYNVSTFLSEQTFNEMFSRRSECKTNNFYTYDAFVTAAKSFPAFGTTGDIDVMKREIAAFLAQTAFQTAGARINDANAAEWGYCYKSFASDNSYCVPNNRYPCVEGERYYPRGAMQIGYNFNYGPAGDSIPEDLLANPDLVGTDPVISFKTALAYWMMSHNPNMPSCHDAMTAYWKNAASNVTPGYGLVTKILTSMCGSDDRRVQFYKIFCDKLGVTYGERNLYCVATKAARVGKWASI